MTLKSKAFLVFLCKCSPGITQVNFSTINNVFVAIKNYILKTYYLAAVVSKFDFWLFVAFQTFSVRSIFSTETESGPTVHFPITIFIPIAFFCYHLANMNYNIITSVEKETIMLFISKIRVFQKPIFSSSMVKTEEKSRLLFDKTF